MRKSTKEGKRKKRQKALKLISKGHTYSDVARGRKLLKQANYVPYGSHTKSNY